MASTMHFNIELQQSQSKSRKIDEYMKKETNFKINLHWLSQKGYHHHMLGIWTFKLTKYVT